MPISWTRGGDIAAHPADILVNTVNTVGVMGKGVALAMKKAFPEIMPAYQGACRTGYLRPGSFLITWTNDGRRVINLATKMDWRDPSRPEWVGYGLFALGVWLSRLEDKPGSLALPLPGAGLGGLDPATVQQMIRTYLAPAARDMEITVLAEELPAIDFPVFFAGVGARKTPPHILELMEGVGELAGADGWGLRSGGAEGADTAFHNGIRRAVASSEIFLAKPRHDLPEGIVGVHDVHERLVTRFHPAPAALSEYAFKLMARNSCQVFGMDFTNPSSAVCCWTPEGRGEGGTGQAIRIAKAAGIPVLDLGRPDLDGIRAEEVLDMLGDMAATWRAERGLSANMRKATPDAATAETPPWI